MTKAQAENNCLLGLLKNAQRFSNRINPERDIEARGHANTLLWAFLKKNNIFVDEHDLADITDSPDFWVLIEDLARVARESTKKH